jgi:transposase
LKAYVKKIKNIKLVYNVPYSPELNPIELLFNELKTYLRNEGINNNDTINKINKAFQNVKRNNLKQYFKKALSFYQ